MDPNLIGLGALIGGGLIMGGGAIGAGVATSHERQLGEWYRRIRVDERHERALLARCILDAGNGQRKVRWRPGCPGSDPAGSGRTCTGYYEPKDYVSS